MSPESPTTVPPRASDMKTPKRGRRVGLNAETSAMLRISVRVGKPNEDNTVFMANIPPTDTRLLGPLPQEHKLSHLQEGLGGICDVYRLEAAEVDTACEVGSIPFDGFVAGGLKAINKRFTYLPQRIKYSQIHLAVDGQLILNDRLWIKRIRVIGIERKFPRCLR